MFPVILVGHYQKWAPLSPRQAPWARSPWTPIPTEMLGTVSSHWDIQSRKSTFGFRILYDSCSDWINQWRDSPSKCPIVQKRGEDNGQCLWGFPASVQFFSPGPHLAPVTWEAELLGDVLGADLIRALHTVIAQEPLLICKYRSYWQRLPDAFL